jgi:dienelactone hydrolase
MDRRRLMLGLASCLATGGPPVAAKGKSMAGFTSGGAAIEAEWFAAGAARGPAVLLLHGADGLTFADGYRFAAQVLAGAGYHVAFVHYLDRTGERRVSYSTLRANFPLWAATVRDAVTWLAKQPLVDPDRVGIVGISLGAALALETAAADPRIKAIVDYFGPLPEGMAARKPRLPPTLILHGSADPIVPVANAHKIEKLLQQSGTPYEVRIYPGQGHAFFGPAQLDSANRAAEFLGRYLAA